MNRFLRDIRLIPIVLLATVSLLALKVSGLVFDGGYTLAERLQGRDKSDLKISTEAPPDYPRIVISDGTSQTAPAAQEKQAWAKEMFNFNAERDVTGSVKKDAPRKDAGDITGSAGGGAPPENKDAGPPLKSSNTPPAPPKLEVGGAAVPLDPTRLASPGERAVLERLQDRRQELEARSRELEMRESLLKAAEKRLDAKAAEIKAGETKAGESGAARDKADADRFKGIVTMYETMKPKEAARIFDRLDMRILVDVSTQMNPRKMSEVLAQMTPEAAERLTVELATRAGAQAKGPSPDQLPKIDGKPTN